MTNTFLACSRRTLVHNRGLVEITDPEGHLREQEVAPFGNIVGVHEHNGGVTYDTTYEYDVAGQLTTVTDEFDNVTSVVYDLLGRKRSLDDPDAGLTIFDYDLDGNLERRRDASNTVVEWVYDALGRREFRTVNGAPDASWIYDTATLGIGLLGRRTDDSGTYELLSYNELGQARNERYCGRCATQTRSQLSAGAWTT